MSKHVHVSAEELFDSSTGLLESFLQCSFNMSCFFIFGQSNKSMQLQCDLYIFTGKKRLIWHCCKLYDAVFLKMRIQIVDCIHDVPALWEVIKI